MMAHHAEPDRVGEPEGDVNAQLVGRDDLVVAATRDEERVTRTDDAVGSHVADTGWRHGWQTSGDHPLTQRGVGLIVANHPTSGAGQLHRKDVVFIPVFMAGRPPGEG